MPSGGEVRRSPDSVRFLNHDTIIRIIYETELPLQDKALAAATYLIGGRIKELVRDFPEYRRRRKKVKGINMQTGLEIREEVIEDYSHGGLERIDDKETEKQNKVVTFREPLPSIQIKNLNLKIVRQPVYAENEEGKIEEQELEFLDTSTELVQKEQVWMWKDIRTEKHRKRKSRDPLIFVKYDADLIDVLLEYADLIRNKKALPEQDTTELFPFSRQIAYKKICQFENLHPLAKDSFHPHALRHHRARGLRDDLGFNDHDLMFFFGWSSIAPATSYVHTTADELKKKMVMAKIS